MDPRGGRYGDSTPDTLEQRLQEEERRIVTNRALAVAALVLGVLLAVAVIALVVALVALDREVDAAGDGTPVALADGSVTAEKLADGFVTAEKLAEGAVGTTALGRFVVTGQNVARDTLPGATIREGTLARVPEAALAGDAAALGGLEAGAYLASVEVVQAASERTLEETRGPVEASCPDGTFVVAGGGAIDGETRGVAIVSSVPTGEGSWGATAEAFASASAPWRLVVIAICAAGGR
ncbi:MAG TPA: hypothetical protein VK915_02630 [Gaiellaceae bacterium]|nr:hypothetical protein [Gaiellaceae bacterium]